MDTKKYWIKQNMDIKILKNYCHVFNHKPQQIKVAARLNRKVPISDIIVDNMGGKNYVYYNMYREVMEKYIKNGRSSDYTKTKLWIFEYSIAPKNDKKQVRRRFVAFFNLFDSIKKKGFKRCPNKMVRLIDIEGKPMSKPVEGERFSPKYYRINGMRRCCIARYLGIKAIPCRVLKVRIVQL